MSSLDALWVRMYNIFFCWKVYFIKIKCLDQSQKGMKEK